VTLFGFSDLAFVGGLTPPQASLKQKFVAWIEASNPATDRVTGNAITGTASVANVTHGSLTKAWTNGTLAGMSIPELTDLTIWFTGHRTGTGDAGTTWAVGTPAEFGLTTFNGVFWTARIMGSSNLAQLPSPNGSVISYAARRAASATLVEGFLNGNSHGFANPNFSNGAAITSRNLTSNLTSIAFMSTFAVSNQVLTLEEIEYLHNGGNFRLWADV
jgi:hypothetical protein